MGVDANSDRYQSDWRTATELDQHTDAQRDAARSDHQRAAAAASAVRQTARAQAEAIAPSAGSPAGGRLLVATMDERLEAMQRHLTTAKAQQQLFAVRLRQLAAAYGLTAPPLAIPPIARFSIPKRLAGMAIPAVHARRQRTPTSAKPPIGGVPHLTRDSTLRQVAARILWEAHRRGYSREQAIAILSTAMRESALNPKAVSPNGLWEGAFQQGASYRDRRDPNGAIAAFFDRLGMKGGPSSPDIWKSIFWLQQRPWGAVGGGGVCPRPQAIPRRDTKPAAPGDTAVHRTRRLGPPAGCNSKCGRTAAISASLSSPATTSHT